MSKKQDENVDIADQMEAHEGSRNSEQRTKLSRRDALRASVIGASAIAFSAGPVLAQNRAPQTPKKEFTGKTAFITGGARGIGLATAEELAKAGANIAIYDIASGTIPHVGYPIATEADLQAAKSKIEAFGVKCLTFKGDVRNKAAQTRAMEQTVSNFGSLDIVVANAGVSQAGRIEAFSDQEISAVFEINVAGVVKTTQAAAPIMRRQKSGRIIYISSALGRMGNELFPIYTASKWAVIGFAKSAALTFGRDNILCNVVCPGLVRTKLADNDYVLKKMLPNDANPSFDRVSEMLKLGNPIPIGHLEAVDIAKAVLFFAGDATAKVTGEVFDISYGSLARSIA
jgi:NAD(P)-dependent dehydrogenase (short-subunit alcohol dehydrogenase family)